MNEFIFASMQCVFVHFLGEIEDAKKAFRNYLTFSIRKFSKKIFHPNQIFRRKQDRNNYRKLSDEQAFLAENSIFVSTIVNTHNRVNISP